MTVSHAQPGTRALDHLLRPTRAEVDLEALRQNLAAVRAVGGEAQVLAVVKANAYGHGGVHVARALESAGVGMLGVALVEEAIELRHVGVRAPILVLGGNYDRSYDLIVEYELIPTVFRLEHLIALSRAAKDAGKAIDVHVKVDTGMGRLGVGLDQWDSFLEQAKASSHVVLDGLLSQLATADVPQDERTQAQLVRFRWALERMHAHGFHPTWRHVSNSAGSLQHLGVEGAGLNLIRPGLVLYGLSPAKWLEGQSLLRPVMSWKTGVAHLKTLAAGSTVSYGATWTAQRQSVIATLPVGYADGYRRCYSNRAQVLVRGRRAPVVGRVCMDMSMIDVTDIPGVAIGDEVVLLGAQQQERITAEELADLADTISYEVVCSIGARVPRTVVG